MGAEMQKPEKIINAIVGADYDYICLISMKSRSYEIFTGKPGELIPERCNDYDAERKHNTAAYVIEQDRERLLREMDLDYVSEKLRSTDKFSTAYGMVSNAGLQYKLDTFFYLDETHQDMVLMRKDVTQLTCRQQQDMDRLRKTLMDLEQAGEAKSAFLSNMSHDLRTPLNGILGFAEIGLKENSAEEKQRCLEKIRMSGTLLLGLVNDTLEYSRIESGKYRLEMETVGCDEIWQPVLTSIRQSASEKNVTFNAAVCIRTEDRIRTDRLALQKIALNLLSNAVKFTPPGGTVSCSVTAIDPPEHGMTRRIVVSDTGIGMSPEFLQHLYEPFAQEQRNETGNVQGTGLGLSIVRHMVDLLKGTIAVESRVGEGTVFTVELPVECVRGDGVIAAAKEKDAGTFRLTGRRVLLCEDNSINAEIATLFLQKEGILVDCAPDGKSGLEKFIFSAEHCYDAVLMDLRMPVMDGFAATRAIRALPRTDAQTVPIIAMTADAFEESIRSAKEAGMNDYLTKPVDSRRLCEVLKNNIG